MNDRNSAIVTVISGKASSRNRLCSTALMNSWSWNILWKFAKPTYTGGGLRLGRTGHARRQRQALGGTLQDGQRAGQLGEALRAFLGQHPAEVLHAALGILALGRHDERLAGAGPHRGDRQLVRAGQAG